MFLPFPTMRKKVPGRQGQCVPHLIPLILPMGTQGFITGEMHTAANGRWPVLRGVRGTLGTGLPFTALGTRTSTGILRQVDIHPHLKCT